MDRVGFHCLSRPRDDPVCFSRVDIAQIIASGRTRLVVRIGSCGFFGHYIFLVKHVPCGKIESVGRQD
ncbi:hypothetical protein BG60_03945 [Caballeronia zhejiangensis]|uniref:Uncharacterized protein n=1 Tax=Caballeronia zhejiangensis TaxID=871203 RepID=A0A656QLG6_9BURK|nr:hypothetical protein BURK_031224 [Burkholderia sp. SJ98]KDR30232.1 hypothetical protein BG60_03945 [Caballeronia zhejiangensis]